MTFWYELLLLCFPLVILLSYVSQVKLIFIFKMIRWLKTHVSLQEAVLQLAGRIIWNDEEKFLSPTTPTCHETITDTPLALLTLLWISSVPPPSLETVAFSSIDFHHIVVPRIYSQKFTFVYIDFQSHPFYFMRQLIGLNLNVLPGRCYSLFSLRF